MLIFKHSFQLLCFLSLHILTSVLAAINDSCKTEANLTEVDFGIRYDVPNSDPPIHLTFSTAGQAALLPMPILLAVIENMQPTCRNFMLPYPKQHTFVYGQFKIKLRNLDLSCGPLTYNDACSALRGLAEFMVTRDAYRPWTWQIWVGDQPRGAGQIFVSGVREGEQGNGTDIDQVDGQPSSLISAMQTQIATS
ncbi:hypothetical protein ACLMJK_004551 [Lecanora helva]